MPLTVGVTGATGFIGQALCRRLSEDGVQVRVLARNPQRAARQLPDVEIQSGDITSQASLARFVMGVDAIVHCAGNVRGATQAQFDAVNVDGLTNLLAAIRTHNPTARLLCLSSLAAREPQLSFYANSKRSSENLLLDEAADLDWTVLRPPAVYGPGDKEMLPLFKLMMRGIALIPGSAQARFSLIYIDDLVSAICNWLENPIPAGQIFTLEDGMAGGYDWSSMAAAISQLSGRAVRQIRPPTALLDSIALCNRSAARLFGYAPMLTPEKLRELRHPDWVCDSTELRNQTSWQPQVQLVEGSRRTLGAAAQP